MRGLNSYPSWVRWTIGVALIFAAGVTLNRYPIVGLILGVMAVGLLVPSRSVPPK